MFILHVLSCSVLKKEKEAMAGLSYKFSLLPAAVYIFEIKTLEIDSLAVGLFILKNLHFKHLKEVF